MLFTDVRSIEEVTECITAALPDHPDHKGLYGVATSGIHIGDTVASRIRRLVADTVLAFMIEKKGAVDNLEQILSEERVEMVQWGGADFSMNIGQPRNMSHPDVVAAKKRTFEVAISMGVPPRAEIESADETKEYLDMGVRHFSVGTDITILHNYWKKEGEQIVRAIEGEYKTADALINPEIIDLPIKKNRFHFYGVSGADDQEGQPSQASLYVKRV
ncbi:MAG: hypothetical protein Ct9H300mP19_21020 [Dehalococcoidia bacterium]|nr:MAG: hypothetical protein Ct9H300mP19_21020 [Dehalococcoidia bacterium]